MDLQRNFIIIALLLISFIIWQSWQIDNNIQIFVKDTKKVESNISNYVVSQHDNFIYVKTDVFSLRINLYGGDIDQADLINYHDKLNSKMPFHLLKTSTNFIYQAQSGLIGKNGPDNPNNGNYRPLYTAEQNVYILSDNKNELIIPLIYTIDNKIIYNKIFIFKRGEYAVNIKYQINNFSNETLELILFAQFKQSINLPETNNSSMNINEFINHAYRGAAYSTDQDKYNKYSFNDIKDKNLNINTKGGWIAMLQQYFATAWIPNIHHTNTLYANYIGNNQVITGFKSNKIKILPNNKGELTTVLWLGPEIQDKMASIALNLDLVVDYGWLWFISQPLFKLLKFIQKFVDNWGIAIIIITFIVRGITYPLTKAQYTSIAKMRVLQPKLEEIRKRFNNDKQRQSQEIMTLYKTEKVNPFGGCLPLLIQMPIFLALYYMLSCSIELRHAPFILWIKDLSSQDPYYILPILMGITMFFIQRISPANITDPIQKKIFTFVPIIFTVFFLWFPSGLVLYYTVSNLVTIIQQKIIYHDLKNIK